MAFKRHSTNVLSPLATLRWPGRTCWIARSALRLNRRIGPESDL